MPQNRAVRSESVGNTKPLTKKQDKQANKYLFTAWTHHYKSKEEAISTLEHFFNTHCRYLHFGIELCPETKKEHFQGYFELPSGDRKRLSELKKLLGDKIRFEAAKGNREANVNYCKKDGLFTVWETKLLNGYSADQLDLIKTDKLYPWQKHGLNIALKGGNDRFVYWFHDNGNGGKTEFTKYMMFYHNAAFVQGKKADIACSVAGKDGKNKAKPIYIFGFPRTMEGFVSYDAIESVKDGCIFSGKYESGSFIFPKPVVFVFANFKPDRKALSADRWKVIDIDDFETVKDPKFEISFD